MIVRIEDTYEQFNDGEMIINQPRSIAFAKGVETIGSGDPLIVDCWVDDVEVFLVSMDNPNVISIREQ